MSDNKWEMAFFKHENREVETRVGVPNNADSQYAKFSLTKKNEWDLEVVFAGLMFGAAMQAAEGDVPMMAHAYLVRRICRIYDALGVDLPIIFADFRPKGEEVESE